MSNLYDPVHQKAYDQNIGNLSTAMTCLENDKTDWLRWAEQSGYADVIAQTRKVVHEMDVLRDMVRLYMRRG